MSKLLSHLSLPCTDLTVSTRFYDAVLGALGHVRVCEGPTYAGYAERGATDDRFALKARSHVTPPSDGMHVAFWAPSREAVDAFHAAALRCGGRDDGSPGLRPHYGPTYYAAFVLDPDSHRIEAVCQ